MTRAPDVTFERHLSLAPRHEPQPESRPLESRHAPVEVRLEPGELPVSPETPAAAVAAEKVTDPFAGFLALPDKPATGLTFDLSSAFKDVPLKPTLVEPPDSPQPSAAAQPPRLVEPERAVEHMRGAGPAPAAPPRVDAFRRQGEEVEIDLDLALVPPPAQPPEAHGPDPEVLATLARLERFLGAIESLRA